MTTYFSSLSGRRVTASTTANPTLEEEAGQGRVSEEEATPSVEDSDDEDIDDEDIDDEDEPLQEPEKERDSSMETESIDREEAVHGFGLTSAVREQIEADNRLREIRAITAALDAAGSDAVGLGGRFARRLHALNRSVFLATPDQPARPTARQIATQLVALTPPAARPPIGPFDGSNSVARPGVAGTNATQDWRAALQALNRRILGVNQHGADTWTAEQRREHGSEAVFAGLQPGRRVRLQYENITEAPATEAIWQRQRNYTIQALLGDVPRTPPRAPTDAERLAGYANGIASSPGTRLELVGLLHAALERDRHDEQAVRVLQRFNRDLLEIDAAGDPVENRETAVLNAELLELWPEDLEAEDEAQWRLDLRTLNRWFLGIGTNAQPVEGTPQAQRRDYILLGRAEESLTATEMAERRAIEEYIDRNLLGLQDVDDQEPEIRNPVPNPGAPPAPSSHGNTTITASSSGGRPFIPSSPPVLPSPILPPPIEEQEESEESEEENPCNRRQPAGGYNCAHGQRYIEQAVEAARNAFRDELHDFFDVVEPEFRIRLVNDFIEGLARRYNFEPPRAHPPDEDERSEASNRFDASAFAGTNSIIDISSGGDECSVRSSRGSTPVKSEGSTSPKPKPGSSTRPPRRNSPVVIISAPPRVIAAPPQARAGTVTRAEAARRAAEAARQAAVNAASSPIRYQSTSPIPSEYEEEDKCAIPACPGRGDLGPLKTCSGGCGKHAHLKCIRVLYGQPRKRIWTCAECRDEVAVEMGGTPGGGGGGEGKRKRGQTPGKTGGEKRRKSTPAPAKEKSLKRKASEVDENETIVQRRQRLRKERRG